MKKAFVITVILSVFLTGVFLAQNNGNPVSNKPAKVETINKEKLQDLIKNRNGKALLLNIWATWCGPCREEFPELVRLESEFKGKNLDIIGISVDSKKEVDSKVIPFLKNQKTNFRVFINGFEKDEDLIDFVDKKWQGEIPVTIIYDQSGSRKSFLIGSQDFDTFKKAVETAMK